MTMMQEFAIQIDPEALRQIELMLENDYTIEARCLRLTIGGKECHGFTYQIGFDEKKPKDIELQYQLKNNQSLSLIMDPFTAHYCQKGKIEYQFLDDQQGFVFINESEEKHRGKFFKNSSLEPEHLINND